MSYTFNPDLSDNISLVRFHIGDTVEMDYRLDDATIQYFVTLEGVGGAVIKCIQHIITRLSQPDERTGNYSRSNANARAGYENLLKIKAQEFNISLSGVTVSSSVALPWRADSYMTDGEQDGAP